VQFEISFDHHPSDAVLEEYALSRLSEPACAAVEEHLLVCEGCQISVQQADEYVRLMKHALSIVSPGVALSHPARPGRRVAFLAIPAMAAAAILALLMVRRSVPPATNEIQLVAMRGGDGVPTLSAHSGPLRLDIDASDLDIRGALRVGVVDSGGRPLWSGEGAISNGKLSINTTIRRSGIYWVRLYSSSGDLLREFGLKVD
jgi:hypothetical protein